MNSQHTKSPCCRAPSQHWGSRRRYCTGCHKTWRIRQKKRGRKLKRTDKTLIIKYLGKQIAPLRILAGQKNCGRSALQTKLQRSLKLYVQKNQEKWRGLLNHRTELIAVADAIWYRVKGKKHTIYNILLRSVSSTEAVICPPIILPGHENVPGWQQAFDTLPKALKNRIIALVSDGATSLVALAKTHNWISQRCHFHLISAVQNYLTTGPRSAQRAYALYVMKIVQQLLRTNELKTLLPLLKELVSIREKSSSRGLRRVLGGLLESYSDYHSYLKYPKLNLPTTSNTAESFIQCIRDLMYRCRGFRSITALEYWLKAISIFKKTMKCNGKKPTKLTG